MGTAAPPGGLNSGSGWIFATQMGRPIDPRQDWVAWKELLGAAGVRQARLHDARHSAATFMLIVGVDGRTVMGQMGWGHAALLTRYQHLVPELQIEVAKRVGDLVYRGANLKDGGFISRQA